MNGIDEIKSGKMDGLYFKFKSIRQWTLLVLLIHSRNRKEKRERRSKKKKCTEVKRVGRREQWLRREVVQSFARDCRQFPQGLVASGCPNKLFRGWANIFQRYLFFSVFRTNVWSAHEAFKMHRSKKKRRKETKRAR